MDARNILQQLQEDPLLASSSAPPPPHSLPPTHHSQREHSGDKIKAAAAALATSEGGRNEEASGASEPAAAAAAAAAAAVEGSNVGPAVEPPPVEARNQRGNFQDAEASAVNEAVRQIAYAVSEEAQPLARSQSQVMRERG